MALSEQALFSVFDFGKKLKQIIEGIYYYDSLRIRLSLFPSCLICFFHPFFWCPIPHFFPLCLNINSNMMPTFFFRNQLHIPFAHFQFCWILLALAARNTNTVFQQHLPSLAWRCVYRASYCNVLMTNQMHNSYNQFFIPQFLSALHVSNESSLHPRHNILY